MKVVLFCGGLGMRMRDGITSAPKPMAMIGDRPLMWHVMRYYAHFGHTDFVLCLGYGASYVKDFFLNYDETRSNDFVLEGGAREVKLFRTDISDWRITFVDTGLNSAIGERLRRVRRFVDGEPMFLANYADVFTDASLPDMIQRFEASNAVASLLAVPPQSSHHVVDVGEDGLITQVTPVRDLRQWENGGYFVLRPEIFDYLNEGEDLVEDALPRLIAQRRVLGYPHKGYWSPGRHGQGAGPARGDVPPGGLPVDDLGSGTLGREQGRHDRGRRYRYGVTGNVVLSLPLSAPAGEPLSVLAIGAHPDDIEIGAGGLLLGLAESRLRTRYVVLTGTEERRQEARNAAQSFMPGADLTVGVLRPARGPAARRVGQREGDPRGRGAVLLARCHHRAVVRTTRTKITALSPRSCRPSSGISSISPTRYRNGTATSAVPSMYVPLPAHVMQLKVELLHKCFPSQRGRDWWDDEVFLGLARLRGMECRARYAEAFTCTKSIIVPAAFAHGNEQEKDLS